MKLTKTHQTIKTLKVCEYCNKPLNDGIEKKRGLCMFCYNKYCVKVQTRIKDY